MKKSLIKFSLCCCLTIVLQSTLAADTHLNESKLAINTVTSDNSAPNNNQTENDITQNEDQSEDLNEDQNESLSEGQPENTDIEKQPKAQKGFAAIYINNQPISSFYKIYTDKAEHPFLSINHLFKDMLSSQIENQTADKKLLISLPDNQGEYWIDYGTLHCGKSGSKKTEDIPPEELLQIDKQTWLSIKAIQQCLPLTVRWDLLGYNLYVMTKFKSILALKKQRKLSYNIHEQDSKSDKKLAKQKPLTPKKKLAFQLRYRLDYAKPWTDDQAINAQLASNIDIFHGTFAVTGSLNNIFADNFNHDSYYNYHFMQEGHKNDLQLGDYYYAGNLLIPYLSLKNGAFYQRYDRNFSANGFIYHGHTIPNIEVDVWRNGVIVEILTTGNDGNYTIKDPNGTSGDTYRLKFYFSDGKTKTQTIKLTNRDFLLKKKQLNIQVQNGSIDADSLTQPDLGNNGRFSSANLSYGVTDNLSIGTQYYHFPVKNNADAAGTDFDWIITPTMELLSQQMIYGDDFDYSVKVNFNYFKNQLIQLRRQEISPSSPLNALLSNDDFFDIDSLMTGSQDYWLLKDIINISSWQLTAASAITENRNILATNVLGAINRHISLSLLGAYDIEQHGSNDFRYSASAYYYFGQHSIIQATHSSQAGMQQSLFMYRYQGLQDKHWDISIGAEQQNTDWTYVSQVDLRIKNRFLVAVSADKHQVSLTLSLIGLIASSPGPTNYDDFSTGTVDGYILAPKRDGGTITKPLANVQVSAAGLTTKSDKNGYFKLTSLPTTQRFKFSVSPSSLDANLTPYIEQQSIYLRPGTSVHINPKLQWIAGIDGDINLGKKLPENIELDIYRDLDSNPIDTIHVSEDGFFVINHLTAGKYWLKLRNIEYGPKPKLVEIKPGSTWVSGVTITRDLWAKNICLSILPRTSIFKGCLFDQNFTAFPVDKFKLSV